MEVDFPLTFQFTIHLDDYKENVGLDYIDMVILLQ